MFRMTNFFMALSFGTALAQLVHRRNLTCPLPFLERPLFRLFDVYNTVNVVKEVSIHVFT